MKIDRLCGVTETRIAAKLRFVQSISGLIDSAYFDLNYYERILHGSRDKFDEEARENAEKNIEIIRLYIDLLDQAESEAEEA